MTKLRGAFVAALALAIVATCVGMAFAAPRPVASDNTPETGFAPAQTCNCHSNFIQEWQGSMHAKALSDPLFKTKLAEASSATSGKVDSFCQKCHGPVATMTNHLTNPDPASASAQGVTCTFCHQVTGPSTPTNNVALMVDPSGVYRAQVATPTAPPHAWAVSPFHASSQLCGSCHNVAHPGNGLPVEATYTEWQNSPQAKAGVNCQDCHMSSSPGQVGPSVGWDAGGGTRRPVYQMSFMGAQVALGNSILAEQMLKNAATVDMVAPQIVEGADNTSVTVTITNVGAGHNLPTGLTEIREMWLEVTFTGPDGKPVELGKHVYGTVLKDANGKYPAQLWDATGVQSDDRIPPMGTSVSSYKFAFPSGVEYGTIKAQLLYRSSPDDLAKKAGVQNPTTVMAEQSQPVYLNAAAERKANAPVLAEASSSPWTPLVIAILGMLLCFGLIIFFVWWGRATSPLRKGPQGGSGSTSPATEGEPSDDDSDKTAVLEPVGTPAEEPEIDAPTEDATEAAE